jgi:hypothetical protein
MGKRDIQRWLRKAYCPTFSEFTVPWVASQGRYGHELAIEWIESDEEHIEAAGWQTLGCLVALRKDDELDLAELKRLLKRVQQSIHKSQNRVRYSMNCFVINVGCYVESLTELAIKTANSVGTVTVDMGNTACKVPSAAEYIKNVQQRGTIGKKRKTVKC